MIYQVYSDIFGVEKSCPYKKDLLKRVVVIQVYFWVYLVFLPLGKSFNICSFDANHFIEFYISLLYSTVFNTWLK